MMRFKAAVSVLAMAMIPFVNANDKVLPVKIPSVVISGSNNSCPLQSTIDENLAQSKVQINRIFEDKINQILDQKSTFCGGSFGWTNIASINMTDSNASCPIGLTRSSNLLGCSRVSHSTMTCDSVTYRVGENYYSQVCGRVLGYQIGATDAFRNVYEYHRSSIDQSYVDGVSLTHGPPGSRQHIWTFAAARHEQDTQPRPAWNCRCINPAHSWPYQEPAFVGNNYFCDTGNEGTNYSGDRAVYSQDLLWDGEGCGSESTCCDFNHPPWFRTTLPQATNDDIEFRLCHGDLYRYEEIVLTIIELYIK